MGKIKQYYKYCVNNKLVTILVIFIITIIAYTILYCFFTKNLDATFLTVMVGFISTAITGIIAVITNKHIEQNSKETQVFNEKQYTIQAINKSLVLLNNLVHPDEIQFLEIFKDMYNLYYVFLPENAKNLLNYLVLQYYQHPFLLKRLMQNDALGEENLNIYSLGEKIFNFNINKVNYLDRSMTDILKLHCVFNLIKENFQINLKLIITDDNFSLQNLDAKWNLSSLKNAKNQVKKIII